MPCNSPDGVGRVRRHAQPPQLSLPVRCLVSDAAAGRRPRPFLRLPTGGRKGKIDFWTSRSNSRVFKAEHRASFRNSQKWPLRLNSLIYKGLTRLDEVWTRSGKNGEYRPNRGREAAEDDEFGRRETEREGCEELPNPLNTRGFRTLVAPGNHPGATSCASKNGGGGGNRTRVRKPSVTVSTCLAWGR